MSKGVLLAWEYTNYKENSLIWLLNNLALLISFTIIIIASAFPFQHFGCWSIISIIASKADFPLESSVSAFFVYCHILKFLLTVRQENCIKVFFIVIFIKIEWHN